MDHVYFDQITIYYDQMQVNKKLQKSKKISNVLFLLAIIVNYCLFKAAIFVNTKKITKRDYRFEKNMVGYNF